MKGNSITLRLVAVLLFMFGVGVPLFSYAATNDAFEVSGWIPYWHDTEGITDVKKHLSQMDAVYPFVYSVTARGELRDQVDLKSSNWKNLIKIAQKKKVEIIPTIMWSDGASIQTVLSSTSSRARHIADIVDMITVGKYDGVDIDYESKKAETINYFSVFLKELKTKLGSKLLTCTIEARTPPSSLYTQVPKVLQYANDYHAIGTYCDRVEIMAYDQQRADVVLNAARLGQPYMPVSDVDWVRKVVALTMVDIPKEKIILGIATYGHHYAVTVAPNWYRDYQKIGVLNLPDMLDIVDEYNVTPSRNQAGEMSFTYIPKSSNFKFPKSITIPNNTPEGNIVAAKALAYANKTGQTVTFNLGWYADAEAMKQKIDLAHEFNLRGVVLFKTDGEEDQKVWSYLK